MLGGTITLNDHAFFSIVSCCLTNNGNVEKVTTLSTKYGCKKYLYYFYTIFALTLFKSKYIICKGLSTFPVHPLVELYVSDDNSRT